MASLPSGRYHVAFARVRTRRVVPTENELPVLEALMLLACLSEARLQRAAAETGITKRWFAEGHSSKVGRVPLPDDIAEHLDLLKADVRARLGSLVERGAVVLTEERTLLLPERLRRRAVLAWNERTKGDPLAQLPRVMYPRTRGDRFAD